MTNGFKGVRTHYNKVSSSQFLEVFHVIWQLYNKSLLNPRPRLRSIAAIKLIIQLLQSSQFYHDVYNQLIQNHQQSIQRMVYQQSLMLVKVVILILHNV
jgi:hypothetical protein